MAEQASSTPKKPKSPPRTVWSGFRDGKQVIEVSAHVSARLAEANEFVDQLAVYGDEDAQAIREKLQGLAVRYGAK